MEVSPLLSMSGKSGGGGILSWLGGTNHHSDHHHHHHHQEPQYRDTEAELGSRMTPSTHHSHHSHTSTDISKKEGEGIDSEDNSIIRDESSDNDASSAESDSDEDMELNKQRRDLVQLPSETELNEIFEKLKNFALKKVMANDISDPSKNWTYNGSRSTLSIIPKINPLDQYLEENVKKLFDENKFPIAEIKETLCFFVTSLDPHTVPDAEHKKMQRKHKAIITKFKTEIKKFYPHLLNAMKALVVYTEQNEQTKGNEKEDAYDKHAFRAWKEVYSYLKSLQTIISFVMKKENISMENFPTEFSAIIKKREENLKMLNEVLMSHRSDIQTLEKSRLERDKQISDINARYNGIDSLIMDMQGKTLSIQSQIRDVINPINIAKQNIDYINSSNNN